MVSDKNVQFAQKEPWAKEAKDYSWQHCCAGPTDRQRYDAANIPIGESVLRTIQTLDSAVSAELGI
jgi:hypothetical protein